MRRGGSGEPRLARGSVALEDGVRPRAGARAGEPELGDEAILERAPEPLDPPLRLWRERVDGLDRQRLERLADLRGILLPAEFFGRRPVIVVALQGAVLIHVDAPRHPVRGHDRPQDPEVARRALLVDEVPAPHQLAARVTGRRAN